MFHIDWRSKRTKATIRFLTYTVMLIMTVVTTTVLIYFAKGYRFNRQTGKITHDGLVLIESKPIRATVSIDGKARNTTPARYVLPAGSYDFKLSAPGYRDWSKTINLAGSYVEWINYPLLFPSSIETIPAMDLPKSTQLLQSPNNQLLFIRDKNDKRKIATIHQVANLDESTAIPLPGSTSNTNNQATATGSYRAIEWSTDSQHILVEHNTGKSIEHLVIDVKNPRDTVNISKLVKAKLSNIHFASSNGELIYATTENGLEIIDTTDEPATSNLLLSKVLSYTPVERDKLLFAAHSETPGLVDVGLLDDGKKYIVDRVKDNKRQYLLSYTSYDGDSYFVVGYSDEALVSIYKNPSSYPNSQQLPESFVDIPIKSPKSLTVSGNKQFVSVRSGKNFAVYDLDNERLFSYSSQLALTDKMRVRWMDSSRFIATVDSKVYAWDFDGTNLQQLVSASDGYPVIFDPKFHRMLTVSDKPSISLKLSSMLADEHPADMLKD